MAKWESMWTRQSEVAKGNENGIMRGTIAELGEYEAEELQKLGHRKLLSTSWFATKLEKLSTKHDAGSKKRLKGGKKRGNDAEEDRRTIEETFSSKFQRRNAHYYRKGRYQDPARKTGEWLVVHPVFKKWVENEDSGILWVTGDPGQGKSVLSKYVLDHVLAKSFSTVTASFFFEDDSVEQSSATIALETMLAHIYLQKSTLIHGSPHESYEKHRVEHQISMNKEFHNQWRRIREIAATGEDEIVCVLDGIDKCNPSDRSTIIKAIQKLFRTELRVRRPKFLVTSRPDQDSLEQLAELGDLLNTISLSDASGEILEMIENGHARVTNEFLDDLGSRLSLGKEELDFLWDQIQENPTPTYLWLDLAFKIIAKSPGLSKGHVLASVEPIPLALDECYEKIFLRSEDAAQAREIMSIMVAAVRPLTLEEIFWLFKLGGNLDSTLYSEGENTEGSFGTMLTHVCCGIVRIKPRVHFVSSTAREFLSSRAARDHSSGSVEGNLVWKGSVSSQSSHAMLAERCMRYLLSNHENPQSRHLLDYASTNWMFHFRSALEEQNDDLTKLARQLWDKTPDGFNTWMSAPIRGEYRLSECASPFTAAAPSGLPPIAEVLLNMGLKPTPDEGHGKWNPLYQASVNGHIHAVKKLLEYGLEIIEQEYFGETPLFGASAQGHAGVVNILLEARANTNVKNDIGESPLFVASKNGHAPVVELLVKADALVDDRKGRDDRTPLHQASIEGHSTVVKVLIAAGADVNCKDDYSKTPLFDAVCLGNLEVVHLLLDSGATADTMIPAHLEENFVDPGANGLYKYVNGPERTSLYEAVEYGHPAIVKALIGAGAEPTKCNQGDSEYGLLKRALELRCSKIAMLLVQTEANSASTAIRNEASLNGLLCRTLEYGQTDVTKEILRCGVDVNGSRTGERTPLHFALQYGHLDIVTALLDAGADCNAFEDYGMETPLHYAVRHGDQNTVKMLLDAGADINISNFSPRSMETPLCCAVQCKNVDMVKYLLSAGAEVDANGYRRNCDAGQRLRKTVRDGTALQSASSNGSIEIMEVLLDAGANVNKRSFHNVTALHAAAASSSPTAVELLLGNDAEVDAVSGIKEEGIPSPRTPLMSAASSLWRAGEEARENICSIMKMLLSVGANPNGLDQWDIDRTSNSGNRPPLCEAARAGHAPAVRLLLEAGAEVNGLGTADSPLYCAIGRELDNSDIIDLLHASGARWTEKEVNLWDKMERLSLQAMQ